MYLLVEENQNCQPQERVFSTSGAEREVSHLNLDMPQGAAVWCEVTGVDEGGVFIPAKAIRVEDSGAGHAWLIFGGAWGLRFKKTGEAWSLNNQEQWGEPFKVFDISGSDIRFKSGR